MGSTAGPYHGWLNISKEAVQINGSVEQTLQLTQRAQGGWIKSDLKLPVDEWPTGAGHASILRQFGQAAMQLQGQSPNNLPTHKTRLIRSIQKHQ